VDVSVAPLSIGLVLQSQQAVRKAGSPEVRSMFVPVRENSGRSGTKILVIFAAVMPARTGSSCERALLSNLTPCDFSAPTESVLST